MYTRYLSFLASFLLISTTLSAQTEAYVTDIVATPNYFITVLFGVMLAIGFQFLLTSLSLAVGVSMTPNLKEAYVESRYGGSDANSNSDDWNETNDATNYGVVVSSAFGVWNVITAAISLFGATALALTLSPVLTPFISITLALTIWAVFYLLMFYLEGKMAGTLIGSLINTAVAGLRAGADTVKGLFAPSPTGQVQKVADNTIEKLRSEIDATFDTDSVASAINKFTDRMADKIDKKVPSYDKLREDLMSIAKESGSSDSNPAKWTALQGIIQKAVDESGNDSTSNQDRLAQLKNMLEEFKGSGNNGNDASSKNYLNKVSQYLETATPEDFDTEKLKSQLKNAANDPKGAARGVADLAKSVDRDTVIRAISKNTSLEREQVEQYADQVTEVLSSLGAKVEDVLPANVVGKVQAAVNGFLDNNGSTGSSSTNDGVSLSGLKNELVKTFNNPQESIDVISRRLESYDRDTLINTLTDNTNIDRSQINQLVAQVEDARTQVSDQIQTLKDKANSAKNQAARRAAIQAEHVRKTAVVASWWLFTAILVSAVAAIGGSMVELF